MTLFRSVISAKDNTVFQASIQRPYQAQNQPPQKILPRGVFSLRENYAKELTSTSAHSRTKQPQGAIAFATR